MIGNGHTYTSDCLVINLHAHNCLVYLSLIALAIYFSPRLFKSIPHLIGKVLFNRLTAEMFVINNIYSKDLGNS